MLRALFSRVSFLRRRELTLSHRDDEQKTDSAERRKRWNQVIAEHQNPRDPRASTPVAGAGTGPPTQ